jgi:hypothetical protein
MRLHALHDLNLLDIMDAGIVCDSSIRHLIYAIYVMYM